MDSLACRFWWRVKTSKHHYLALKSWKFLYTPKGHGGLGVKCFTDINMVILSELKWKLVKEDDGLWVHVLKTKYLSGECFFKCKKMSGDSIV